MSKIIRVQKDKDNPYVIMNKNFLSDKNLSWKAKGILSYLLSKPDDWEVVMKDLINQSKDGEKSVIAGINELKKFNYMKRFPIRDKCKIVKWETYVYEYPQSQENSLLAENRLIAQSQENSLLAENLQVENLQVENLQVENEGLLNNELTNNELTNNNLSIYHENKKENDEWMDYKKIIAENISYDSLKIDFDNDSMVDNVYNIIVDVVSSNVENIKISGDNKPLEVVKSIFLKLNENHIKYFIESFQDNDKPIKNIKPYIITALYNSYYTIDLHYKNKINQIYNE